MNQPVIFVNHYWELHWLYPLIKRTSWAVIDTGRNQINEFCRFHEFPMISLQDAEQNCSKVILNVVHFGEHGRFISKWIDSGKQAYVIQRAFDSALAVYDEFWGVDMRKFTKYLVASQFDYDLLSSRFGDKVKFTGSPRLWMASEAVNKNLDKIYEKVGTKNFYVATVIGGLPIHDDNLPDRYQNELPTISPCKIVYKLHPDGNLEYHREKYPNNFFWPDNIHDVWETYKLVAASRGVITPSSFLAIEATIMEKPVILFGDVHQDEYNRQEKQRQRERLPREMSSHINNPGFNLTQEKIRNSYKFDKGCIDRVIYEVLN